METAAVYCRVSALAQSKEGVSLEAQMETCKRWASAQDIEIYKPLGQDAYVDVITGVKKDRPALNQLIEDARSRRFKKVICMRLDRLGRSLKDLIELYTLYPLRDGAQGSACLCEG